jgi:hypothetical protein
VQQIIRLLASAANRLANQLFELGIPKWIPAWPPQHQISRLRFKHYRKMLALAPFAKGLFANLAAELPNIFHRSSTGEVALLSRRLSGLPPC